MKLPDVSVIYLNAFIQIKQKSQAMSEYFNIWPPASENPTQTLVTHTRLSLRQPHTPIKNIVISVGFVLSFC